MTLEMHPSRWGDPAAAGPLPDTTRGLVELAFGIHESPAVTSVSLPAASLPVELLADLRALLGDEHVLVDDDSRRLRTRGKSTPDLLRARAGDLTDAPEAEALLAVHGLTLGHYPQSFEFASIGGFAATRSSGQSSAGYGRFDALVVGLTVATPAGTLSLGSAPANAAGPDLRQLVLGSEGAFGVITSVTVRVRRETGGAHA